MVTDAMILCTCAAHEKLDWVDAINTPVRDATKLWFTKNIYTTLMIESNPEKLYRELVLFVRETTESELKKLKTEK